MEFVTQQLTNLSIWTFIVAVLALKFLLNLTRYYRTKWYLWRYTKWIMSDEKSVKLLESKSQVVRLLRDAGVANARIPISQNLGYGQVANSYVSVSDNFPSARQDFAYPMHNMFREAIGTYRARMWQTFSPLYWIETILFLPRETLGYLGVPAEKALVKLLNVVWWIMGLPITVALALYPTEIRDFIEGLF